MVKLRLFALAAFVPLFIFLVGITGCIESMQRLLPGVWNIVYCVLSVLLAAFGLLLFLATLDDSCKRGR